MPTIAEKLCHDIVEPEIKQSSANAGKLKSTSKFGNSSSNGKQNVKPIRFAHIDKKTNSKVKTSHTNGMTVIKCKTSTLKSLAEAAVNTLVSGPLRCDNNCVTVIRKREQQRSCRCGQKRANFKASSKSIQTINKKDLSLTDKACTQCVETATCGTQPFYKTSIHGYNKVKSKSYLPGSAKYSFKTRTESYLDRSLNITRDALRYHQEDTSMISKPPNLRNVSAKHWALSNYPTRGPDF